MVGVLSQSLFICLHRLGLPGFWKSALMHRLEDRFLEGKQGKQTSPFARAKISIILSPFAVFETTSDATHPSVASGCHAFVPTS